MASTPTPAADLLRAVAEEPVDPAMAATSANLRYVHDSHLGIRRVRRGKGVVYLAPDGAKIRDERELQRIRALRIPPAWTDVWICPDPQGHIQATGRDAKGRKQYRYHPRWRAVRDETKFERMIAFGEALPLIHQRTEEHVRLSGLPREKVLATVVRLLETTLIRVGNAEYARDNKSFGLTTLRDRHVEIDRATLRFEFRGKHGKRHIVDIHDRRLARIVGQCRDIPGQDLFQYIAADGSRASIGSADVNAYLREIAGQDFTAKDFRTWAGTVLAAQALAELGACDSEASARRNVVAAVERVARKLGNTPTICRACYIHPAVIDAYLSDGALEVMSARAADALPDRAELDPAERAVLDFLRTQRAEQSRIT